MRIGILALQGAFAEHRQAVERLGAETVEVRQPSHLTDGMDGLIIPGGESTVMRLLLERVGLVEPLRTWLDQERPVFGTCAGLILLARQVDRESASPLAALDVAVTRNAYGRQLGSFSAADNFAGTPAPMVFIRAPRIDWFGPEVKPLAWWRGTATAVQERNILACAFHPELTGDLTVHRYFLAMAVGRQSDTRRSA